MIRVIPGLAVTSITRIEDGEHAVEQATFLAQNDGERVRVTITTTKELDFGRYAEGKAYALTIDDGSDFSRPFWLVPARETVAKDIADHANAALFDHVDAIERDEIVNKIQNLVRGRLNKGRRSSLTSREVALLRHVATFPGGAETDRPRGWKAALEALTARGLVVSYAAGGLRATGDGLAELSRHPATVAP